MLELYNSGNEQFAKAATVAVTVSSFNAAFSLPTIGELSYNYGYYFNYMMKITKL